MLVIHSRMTALGSALSFSLGKLDAVNDPCHFQSTFSGTVEDGQEQ